MVTTINANLTTLAFELSKAAITYKDDEHVLRALVRIEEKLDITVIHPDGTSEIALTDLDKKVLLKYIF